MGKARTKALVIAGSLVLLTACTADEDEQLPDEVRDALTGFPAVRVIEAPSGYSLSQSPALVDLPEGWQELAAEDSGCRFEARVSYELGEDFVYESIRAESRSALDELAASGESGSAEFPLDERLIPSGEQSPVEGQIHGLNFVTLDQTRGSGDDAETSRIVTRRQPVPIPLSDGGYMAFQQNDMRLTCPGEVIDEGSWDRILMSLRTAFIGQEPEEPGSWTDRAAGT